MSKKFCIVKFKFCPISKGITSPCLTNDSTESSPMSDFESSVEISGGEKTSHTFSKLPEIFGSGFPYTVQIRIAATSSRDASFTQKTKIIEKESNNS